MAMTTSRSSDIVVAGYLGMDLAPGFANAGGGSFAEWFRPGKLIETKGLHLSLGGVVANTGWAMKKFGCRVELMGCVGQDPLGDLAVAQLAEAGFPHGIRRSAATGTAYGIVLAPPGLDRLFLEDPGCNRWFTSNDLDWDVIEQSRLFHFGYPPLMDTLWADNGLQLKQMLERVRVGGTVVSLDMALPDPDAPAGKADWRAILGTTLPLVDIFVPSIEELLLMLDPECYAATAAQTVDADLIDMLAPEAYARLAEEILDMGVKILLIKAGHKGAYLRTGPLTELAAPPLELTDTTGCPEGIWLSPEPVNADRLCNASGAGDCAAAGFLAALLKGESLATAGHCAMIAGRDNLYGSDATSGLRNWDVMTAALNNGNTE